MTEATSVCLHRDSPCQGGSSDMAHIRKRALPSGKIRWQVIWLVNGKRASAMFETQRAANEKRKEVEGSRPSSSAPFRTMAQEYLDHKQQLVDGGEQERSYFD